MGTGQAEVAEAPFQRGDAIDRFTVLEPLGQGGMGVVVSAYDCILNRKVAIKVLRPDRLSVKPEEGRARLLREAQAMARLRHPNVITVYEVGAVGEQVFVAMELVEGETLASWMQQESRPWREVVRTFVRAGQGLAAAHRAGMVHRDFKPENVLVGSGDEVRVTDFGLASVSSGSAVPEEMMLGARLTRTGTIVGTPAYMSPEQHRGEDADARSDQFSFCVGLYEALYGVSPFAGETLAQVREAILGGRLVPPQREAPRWLRPLIVRGLQARPEDRWPSLEALLEALARDPAATRRRWLLWGGAAAVAVATLVGGLLSSRDRPALCQGAAARVASIWATAARERVRAAFLATGSPIAADTFAHVDRALHARLAAWADAHTEACRATQVTGEQSPAVLDLRMQCLERARRQIASLVELWQDEEVDLDRAVPAAATAGGVDACADTEALSTPIPPPRDPESVRQVEEVRARLDQVVAHWKGGGVGSGLVLARAAVGAAARLGYAPLAAEALYYNGQFETEFGKLDVAESLLYAAARAGAEAHDDVLVAKILRFLVYTVGTRAKRYADAAAVLSFAETWVARAGNRDDMVAELLHTQGALLLDERRDGEALPRLERALAMYEKLRGPEHPDTVPVLHDLAITLTHLGRFDESIALFRRVLTLHERTAGAEHFRVALILNNLAYALYYAGEYGEAGRQAERALAIREKLYPPDHPNVSLGLNTLGDIRKGQGRVEEARDLWERAERIRAKALGANHLWTANTRANLAVLATERGDLATARTLAESVLDARIRGLGPDQPDVAGAWIVLGNILIAAKHWKQAEASFSRATAILRKQAGDEPELVDALNGIGKVRVHQRRYAEAIALHEEARAIFERFSGPEHPYVTVALVPLGDAYLAAGRNADAVAILQHVVALGEKVGSHGNTLGVARFHLARALWASGARERALGLARAARDELVHTQLRPDLAEAERWLRGRR